MDKYLSLLFNCFGIGDMRCTLSPRQVLVFLVNLTQILQPAKTVKFSKRSSCFESDINGHRTSCKKPEMWEISTSQSTPFSFGIPIFRICK